MSDWPRQPLVELATVTMGQSPDSAAVNGTEAGLPFLQGCAEFGERFPSPRLHCSPPLRVAKAGSTLISVRAPVGTTNRADQDYCIGRGLGAVLAKSGVADDVFLLHAIEANLEFLHRRSQGSTFLAISSKDLYSLPVPAPSLPTQRRIAEILSTLDEAIEQTEALIAKMQQVKAGLMHDLFTRGVTPDGRLRPTREAQRTKFGWIPKAWRIGSLIDVADPCRQPILTGPFGADLGNNDFVPDGIPVLRIGNVQQSRLDLLDLLYVAEVKARELNRYVVREGDLLFARQGATTGRNALVSHAAHGFLINYHIIRVALDHSKCAPLFIEAAFNGDIVKNQIERDKGRGTREGINTAQLRALELPLTSVNEQRAIAKILMAHGEKLGAMQRHLKKLSQIKCGLMYDLLSGRVRLPVGQESHQHCQIQGLPT